MFQLLQKTNEDPINTKNTATAEYSPENVFNTNEIGLFYQLLPPRSLIVKGGGVISGGKKSKQRITQYSAVMPSEQKKLKSLVIEKSRCFKLVPSHRCD